MAAVALPGGAALLLNARRARALCPIASASGTPRGSSRLTLAMRTVVLAQSSGLPEGLTIAGFAALQKHPALLLFVDVRLESQPAHLHCARSAERATAAARELGASAPAWIEPGDRNAIGRS
jgi:hypothetical protein